MLGSLQPDKTVGDKQMRMRDHDSTRERVAILLGWCAIVLLVALRHEMWRDEVRALSFAMDAKSLADLAALLKNEGHPMLWHTLLYAGYGLTGAKWILPLGSALLCAGAVVIFVFKSPFPNWIKALFVFGGLPSYEYSVMARNYGISMLLMFLFAWAYPKRHERPLWLGALLALLANTNIHSLLLAGCLLAFWLWDELVHEPSAPLRRRAAPLSAAVVLVAVAAAFSLWTMWPTAEITASDVSAYTVANVAKALGRTAVNPAGAFHEIAPGDAGALTLVASMVLAASTLGLVIEPIALVTGWAGLFALSVLFQVVYKGDYRHQGLFVVFLLTLYWIVLARAGKGDGQRLRGKMARVGLSIGLPIILSILVVTGAKKIYVDVRRPMSASQDFGAFLRNHTEYAHAVLVAEPDFYVESVRYYVDNPIFILREQRFGDTIRFVRSAQLDLTLAELLRGAWDVHLRTQRPVLIVLGHLDELDPGAVQTKERQTKSYLFKRTFSWSADEVADLRACTKLLQPFDDHVAEDERYRVYELLSPPR